MIIFNRSNLYDKKTSYENQINQLSGFNYFTCDCRL